MQVSDAATIEALARQQKAAEAGRAAPSRTFAVPRAR